MLELTALNVAAALLSGAIVGFVLGLVGGGGSILATPLLLYVVGITQPHIAIGTSALAVSANAYANFVGHVRKHNVNWPCAIVFALIGAAGALLGSGFGKVIDGQILMLLFGVLMIIVGALMLLPRKAASIEDTHITQIICWKTAAIALGAGMAAGFFGIGGGFLIVPGLLLATRMPMIRAIGTSLLAVGSFGLATALNYALSNQVDWLVAGLFILGGIGGGIIGTQFALRLSTHKDRLNQIFAVMIFLVAAYVIYHSTMALMG